jgi:NAD(P)-dependent dehydrogenase (short-subunit alcohol dehydrogenase family)
MRLVILKLVGYTEVVHALVDRLTDDASIVLFGGMAKERPYPGSTTVTTVNGGVVGLTRTLVEELRPIRVNSLHPGVVGNSPYWAEKPAAIAKYTSETPLGRLATMDEIVDAAVFLFENTAINGVDLVVDGGWHCR